MYKSNSFLKVEEVYYSHEELINSFTPLDYLINGSKYVGENLLDDCDTYLIYYLILDEKQQVPNHYLFVRDGRFGIETFNYADIYNLSGKHDKEIDDKYHDKNKIKVMVKRQLISTLRENIHLNENNEYKYVKLKK